MASNGPSQLGRRIGIFACVALVPLSLWCFSLANHAVFPSRWIRNAFGPQERAGFTSAPDYMEWDVATMILMLAVCGVAVLYLAAQVVRRMRGPTAG